MTTTPVARSRRPLVTAVASVVAALGALAAVVAVTGLPGPDDATPASGATTGGDLRDDVERLLAAEAASGAPAFRLVPVERPPALTGIESGASPGGGGTAAGPAGETQVYLHGGLRVLVVIGPAARGGCPAGTTCLRRSTLPDGTPLAVHVAGRGTDSRPGPAGVTERTLGEFWTAAMFVPRERAPWLRNELIAARRTQGGG